MSADREEFDEDVCQKCGSADWEVREYMIAHCNDCDCEWRICCEDL